MPADRVQTFDDQIGLRLKTLSSSHISCPRFVWTERTGELCADHEPTVAVFVSPRLSEIPDEWERAWVAGFGGGEDVDAWLCVGAEPAAQPEPVLKKVISAIRSARKGPRRRVFDADWAGRVAIWRGESWSQIERAPSAAVQTGHEVCTLLSWSDEMPVDPVKSLDQLWAYRQQLEQEGYLPAWLAERERLGMPVARPGVQPRVRVLPGHFEGGKRR